MGSLLDELLTNQLAVGAGEEEKEKDFVPFHRRFSSSFVRSMLPSLHTFIHVYCSLLFSSLIFFIYGLWFSRFSYVFFYRYFCTIEFVSFGIVA